MCAHAAGAQSEEVELVVRAGQRDGELGEAVDERALDQRWLTEAAAARYRCHRTDEHALRLAARDRARSRDGNARLEAGAADVRSSRLNAHVETLPPSHDAAVSSSRCASSKTTASCSGRIEASVSSRRPRSAKYRAWLTITRSAARASAAAASEKHVATNGHLRPRQPSAPTASSLQSVSEGSASSARSPVSSRRTRGAEGRTRLRRPPAATTARRAARSRGAPCGKRSWRPGTATRTSRPSTRARSGRPS